MSPWKEHLYYLQIIKTSFVIKRLRLQSLL